MENHLYKPLAFRVSTVLEAAREGSLNIEMYSQEHQSLVDIVNRLVEWDIKKTRRNPNLGKIKLTLLQAKTLNKAYKEATQQR